MATPEYLPAPATVPVEYAPVAAYPAPITGMPAQYAPPTSAVPMSAYPPAMAPAPKRGNAGVIILSILLVLALGGAGFFGLEFKQQTDATNKANDSVNSLNGQVNDLKSQLNKSKSDLQTAQSDLQTAQAEADKNSQAAAQLQKCHADVLDLFAKVDAQDTVGLQNALIRMTADC
jgi:uncharacterized protein HemX